MGIQKVDLFGASARLLIHMPSAAILMLYYGNLFFTIKHFFIKKILPLSFSLFNHLLARIFRCVMNTQSLSQRLEKVGPKRVVWLEMSCTYCDLCSQQRYSAKKQS